MKNMKRMTTVLNFIVAVGRAILFFIGLGQ